MKIAVTGCVHGKLDQIYKDIENFEKKEGNLIDLVIITGDFQAARNENDLKCMNIKEKYKKLGDFHAYYNGNKKANRLTLVIGGNHEASNYFQTLPYGGWIAKNIFYMGYSNLIKVNGVRIAGISGIFNRNSTNKGHYEFLPYDNGSKISSYHTRYLEVFRIMQIKEKLDVMITHDWPLHIYNMPGAKEFLIRKKPFFKEDIRRNQLGSPLYEIILNKLKPSHWFSSHLHVRFETNYAFHQVQNVSNNESLKNDGSQPKPEITHFLALDKCEPKRKYLEILDIESDESNTNGLEYDLEWLAILKATDEYVSTQEYPIKQIPQPHVILNYDLDELKEKIKTLFNDNFKVNEDFKFDLPFDEKGEDMDPDRLNNYVNEQTNKICKLLELTDPIERIIEKMKCTTSNPDKIEISDCEDSEDQEKALLQTENLINKEDDTGPSAKRFKEEQSFFIIDKEGSR